MKFTKKIAYQRVAALLAPKSVNRANFININNARFSFKDSEFTLTFGDTSLVFEYAKLVHLGMSSNDAGTMVIGTQDEKIYVKLF